MPRALKGVLIGYPKGVKGYKIWCTNLNPPKQCTISRDIIFNGSEMAVKKQPIEVTNNNIKPFEILEFKVEPPNHRNIEEAAASEDSVINSYRTQESQ